MKVNPAEPAAVKTGRVQEMQHLMVLCQSRFGQCWQETQDLLAAPQVATGQLTHHERVAKHLVIVEKRL